MSNYKKANEVAQKRETVGISEATLGTKGWMKLLVGLQLSLRQRWVVVLKQATTLVSHVHKNKYLKHQMDRKLSESFSRRDLEHSVTKIDKINLWNFSLSLWTFDEAAKR